MSIEPRTKRLFILLAFIVPVAGWRYLGPVLGRLAGDGAFLGAPRRAVDVATLDVIDLDLETLAAPAHDYTPGRNIFQPYTPPPPPPPPPFTPPPPAPPPPPYEPPVPVPPPIDFELVGIFGPDARRIAVLFDGETTTNALLGEEINEKFIVDRIGFESIDVRFVGFPDVAPRLVEIEE